jgi:4-hydroxy-tetrahydrodipicolinate reductase
VRDKKLGHVGLGESALLIARGLGWHLERYEESIEPALGSDGNCLGLKQRGRGLVGGVERISLALDMYVGALDPHDRIVLDADPPLDCTLAGGTHGDRATVGTTVNALARLRSLPRGFVTVGEVFA